MATVEGISVDVRDVTDAEVGHFVEKGWVFTPGLVKPELAEELVTRAKKVLGESGDAAEGRQGLDIVNLSVFNDRSMRQDDPVFAALALTPSLGRSASRMLIGAEMPMRLGREGLAVKLPASSGAASGAAVTGYHQDFPGIALDRNSIQLWIALTDVTPEMGSMRFYEGSDRLGSMGTGDDLEAFLKGRGGGAELWDRWPRLKDCPMTEPLTYRPGDATWHNSLTVHGAPANSTEKPRWAYLIRYVPADSRWTGQPYFLFDDKGIAPGGLIDHPLFPVVYDPNA
jgi:ectoine hydroxylase-related dioxygenase (phytanoyl-CoA dioxygenase family)